MSQRAFLALCALAIFALGYFLGHYTGPLAVTCRAEDEVIVTELIAHQWVPSHCRNLDDLVEIRLDEGYVGQ